MSADSLFGPLTLTTVDDKLHIVGDWPKYLGLSGARLATMETAGSATRRDDEIRIDVANGWARYQVTREADGVLEMELLDGEVEG